MRYLPVKSLFVKGRLQCFFGLVSRETSWLRPSFEVSRESCERQRWSPVSRESFADAKFRKNYVEQIFDVDPTGHATQMVRGLS